MNTPAATTKNISRKKTPPPTRLSWPRARKHTTHLPRVLLRSVALPLDVELDLALLGSAMLLDVFDHELGHVGVEV